MLTLSRPVWRFFGGAKISLKAGGVVSAMDSIFTRACVYACVYKGQKRTGVPVSIQCFLFGRAFDRFESASSAIATDSNSTACPLAATTSVTNKDLI